MGRLSNALAIAVMPLRILFNAVKWLCLQFWNWQVVSWLVSVVFIGLAFALAQYGLYVWGRVFLVIGAILFASLIIRDAVKSDEIKTSEKYLASVIIIGVCIALCVGGLSFIDVIRWKNEMRLHVLFKSSTLFTEKRRNAILWELNDYYRYFTDLGFDFPPDVPPLGTLRNIGSGSMSSPGAVYDANIYLPEDALDKPEVVRTQYALYLFKRQMIYQDGTADPFSSEMGWIFPCYYGSSFIDKPTCDIPQLKAWLDALWDIRATFGKENTDKLMYYAFVTRQNTFKKHSDFNSFFRERFGRGLAIIENSQEDRQKAMEILKKHGLPTD